MITIPECTLCGREVDRLFLAVVEGTKIEICEACGKFGNVLKEIRPEPKVEIGYIKKSSTPELEEPEEELKPDYGRLIIQARQKLELERKEFSMKIKEKESIIRRVELQQMTPDDRLIKKIEDFLEIRLTKVYEKAKLDHRPMKGTLTLGDIVKLE